jgi:hypothetical protein
MHIANVKHTAAVTVAKELVVRACGVLTVHQHTPQVHGSSTQHITVICILLYHLPQALL